MKRQTAKKSTTTKSEGKKTAATNGHSRNTTTSSRNRNSAMDGASSGEENESALRELFVDELKDIFWAEKHLLKALPKMAKAASSEELRQAFETHTEQTRGQVEKLEEVFQLLDEKAQGKKCDGMEGIVKEGEKVIEETEEGSMTRDAGLIVSAQKVEHYEIATYGSLTQLAKTMGHDEVAEILGGILAEEKETDELLSGIAESSINIQATHEEAD